ncbi:MAG: tetratricopeptide repeat protein [Spirochaetales bacterium]|nr:tetratricopeptide repeat protein [Spirochaetales bacterium]
MKSKYFYVSLLSLLSFAFFLSCSSAPAKPDAVSSRKNRAADITGFGNNYFIQGQYNQALVFFKLALDENTAVDFEPGISRTSNSIGKVYLVTGEFDKAEQYLNDAYEIAKKLENRELTAISARNMAELYIEQGKIEESDALLNEALSNSESYPLIKAEVYHTVAISLRKKGNFSEAISYIDRASEINLREKAHSSLAANYYLAASVYSRQNNFSKSVEMLNKAIDEDRIVENSYGLAKDYKALGIVHLKNSKPEEAYPFFIKSIKIFDVIDNKSEIKSVLEYLIEISTLLDRPLDAAYFKSRLTEIPEKKDTYKAAR